MVGFRLVLLIGFVALPITVAAEQATPAQVAQGAKVYAAQKCSICHSVAGVGNKKLPLDGVGTKLTVEQIREWIVTPVEAAKKVKSTIKPPMRAYDKVPPADLDALVAYMKSLTSK